MCTYQKDSTVKTLSEQNISRRHQEPRYAVGDTVWLRSQRYTVTARRCRGGYWDYRLSSYGIVRQWAWESMLRAATAEAVAV